MKKYSRKNLIHIKLPFNFVFPILLILHDKRNFTPQHMDDLLQKFEDVFSNYCYLIDNEIKFNESLISEDPITTKSDSLKFSYFFQLDPPNYSLLNFKSDQVDAMDELKEGKKESEEIEDQNFPKKNYKGDQYNSFKIYKYKCTIKTISFLDNQKKRKDSPTQKEKEQILIPKKNKKSSSKKKKNTHNDNNNTISHFFDASKNKKKRQSR